MLEDKFGPLPAQHPSISLPVIHEHPLLKGTILQNKRPDLSHLGITTIYQRTVLVNPLVCLSIIISPPLDYTVLVIHFSL